MIKVLRSLPYVIALWLIGRSAVRRGKVNDLADLFIEALINISTVITTYLAKKDERDVNQYQFPFAILEAQVFAAYTLRNSDVVETDLHSLGHRLTGELMVEFNNEASRLAYKLLKAKSFLYWRGLWWVWRRFVLSYHYIFCHDWTFYSSERPDRERGLAEMYAADPEPAGYVSRDGLLLLPEKVRDGLNLRGGGGLSFIRNKETGRYEVWTTEELDRWFSSESIAEDEVAQLSDEPATDDDETPF